MVDGVIAVTNAHGSGWWSALAYTCGHIPVVTNVKIGVKAMDMTDFEAQRPRLSAIATRILGSQADADDVLQDAWLRCSLIGEVDNPPAWLTTVVTRRCLDLLRSRRVRGAVPEALSADVDAADPQDDVLLSERVGDAMQVVLDALAPAERAALVLHDVFGYPFEEISIVMGRSATAVRQLASRARRKVRGLPESAHEHAARVESRPVVDAFLKAARGGDLEHLLRLLAPDAAMHADLAAQQMGSEPSYDGAGDVAGRLNGVRGATPATIDGELGAAWIQAGVVKVAFVFHVEAGLVQEIEMIADPEVLSGIEVVRLRVRS